MPERPVRGQRTGSTGTGSTGSGALSAIRGQRNHAKKIIGKPYAGKPHVRIERGMGKRAVTGTAPLTTNDEPRRDPPLPHRDSAGRPRGPQVPAGPHALAGPAQGGRLEP